MIMLSGRGGGGCKLSVDWDRDRGAEPLLAAGDGLRFAPPLAGRFRERAIDFYVVG